MNGPGVIVNQGGDEHFTQRFALRPHGQYDPVSAMRFALEHQNSLIAGQVSGGDAYPEDSFSLLSVDNPGVLLWALKPAEDGLESGVVARVWNVSNESGKFSLSLAQDGLSAALFLTHIETPVGVAAIEEGKLVDTINQQQIKIYALFPSELPLVPDTSGLSTSTITPEVQVTATIGVEASAIPTQQATKMPSPAPTSTEAFASESKGCLLGLLGMLMGLMK